LKLVNFEAGSGMEAGVVVGREVFGLAELGFPSVRTVEDLLTSDRLEELGAAMQGKALKGGLALATAKLHSPVLSPDKILCAAVNYATHGKEGGATPPAVPYFFTKFRSCIIGDGDPILIPRISKKADWEVELAVVIGRKGKYIDGDTAMDHVAGYCVANDVSFRDLQFPPGWPEKPSRQGMNWVKGKALDGAFPLGPWLVTRDEVPDPRNLKISLKVNGAVRQSSTTGDMIFDVAKLVEHASSGLTLLPGDVISTGTPSGVANYSGVPFLKAGDSVVCEIERVGTLSNPVETEP
jgi:2-keto-4-pentenoate hydratase/2-oxohepta-3-ene-1,7-dioic acid hydratase in catechol pathway